MARRNQEPIVIKDFDGVHSYPRLYVDDGGVDNVGPNGAEAFTNLMCDAIGQMVNRPRISAGHHATGLNNQYGTAGIKRIFGIGLGQTAFPVSFLVLGYDGKVWRDTNTVTPIYTATAGTDMCVFVHGNRIYFSVSPTAGTAAIFIYDCDTGAAVRAAAGLKPAGTFTVATSATAGHVEVGQHIYAVAYETSTGFITKPNLYVSLTNVAGRKVDMNPIPTGPAGTVARHILMSRVLKNWDGNLQNPELFFAVRIGDNTTTNQSGANGLDKYDSELVSSADYLKDVTEELIRANAMCLHRGRFINVGGSSAAPVRISQPGDLETFLATEGYLKAYPLEGIFATKNCADLNGVLYIFRPNATFATQDTGESPTRWPVTKVHSSLGASNMGVATVSDGSGSQGKHIFVLNRSGIYYFDGAYQEPVLTLKVGGLWVDQIIALNEAQPEDFGNWSMVVDEGRKLLYAFVGRGPSTGGPSGHFNDPDNFASTQLLVGDYGRGLSYDKIRWYAWKTYQYIQCMSIFFPDQNSNPEVIFGQGNSNGVKVGWVMSLDRVEIQGIEPKSDQDITATNRDTPWLWLSAPLGLSNTGGRTNTDAVGIRAAVHGLPAGSIINVRLYHAENDVFVAGPSIQLVNRTDTFRITARTYLSPVNVTAERVKIELSGSVVAGNPSQGIRIMSVTLHAHVEDEEQPA